MMTRLNVFMDYNEKGDQIQQKEYLEKNMYSIHCSTPFPPYTHSTPLSLPALTCSTCLCQDDKIGWMNSAAVE